MFFCACNEGIEVVDDVGGDINNLSFIVLFHSNITRSVLGAKMGSFKITATPRALTPPPAAPLRLRDTHDAPSPERQFMCIYKKQDNDNHHHHFRIFVPETCIDLYSIRMRIRDLICRDITQISISIM